jgi:hypothetical protein
MVPNRHFATCTRHSLKMKARKVVGDQLVSSKVFGISVSLPDVENAVWLVKHSKALDYYACWGPDCDPHLPALITELYTCLVSDGSPWLCLHISSIIPPVRLQAHDLSSIIDPA